MPRKADPNKPKRNVWTDPSPYGTYEGPKGTRAEWASAFSEAWDVRTAKNIIKDESAWDILGVAAGTSFELVKKAYRDLVKVHHPDHGGDAEKCKKIIAAYAVLKEQFNS